MMRALEPEVLDAVFSAIEPLLPERIDAHPLGCHRPRASDRLCFEGILIRLVTGCSWSDAERLLGGVVSDTTLRTRRDEWNDLGVFEQLVDEALRSYDTIIGLDLSEVAIDGSQHKAPMGAEGTGRNPTDKDKSGWKWSLLTDQAGIPIGWATDGANRNDVTLFEPTIQAADKRGLLADVETLHLDRGYDSRGIRATCEEFGLDDLICAKRRPRRSKARGRYPKITVPMGKRWPIERTNPWLSNFGQLRRNTDRFIAHRMAQLALAIILIIVIKLIDWRDRWSPR
jgi:transposase